MATNPAPISETPPLDESKVFERFFTDLVITYVMGEKQEDGEPSGYNRILEGAEEKGIKIKSNFFYDRLLSIDSKETDNYILNYMIENGATLENYIRLFELKKFATLHCISDAPSSNNEAISQFPVPSGWGNNIKVNLPSDFYVAMFQEGLLGFIAELPQHIPYGKHALARPMNEMLGWFLGTIDIWPGYKEASSVEAIQKRLGVLLAKMTGFLEYYNINPKLVYRTQPGDSEIATKQDVLNKFPVYAQMIEELNDFISDLKEDI